MISGAEKDNAIARFFNLQIWRNPASVAILWAILAIVAALMKGGISGDKCNNFLIFRKAYYHLIELKPLYGCYPEEYSDQYLYGPVFSLVIAVFAMLPKIVGLLTWLSAMALSLYVAIRKLPLKQVWTVGILWIVTPELLSAMQMAQFNIVVASLILGCYISIEKQKHWLAGFCLALGTLTKIYGVVAIVFLLFSKRKGRFILWTMVWMVVMIIAPMLISSPEYICEQYVSWYHTIVDKNAMNVAVGMNIADNYYQNISVMGMLHRITQLEFSDLYILVAAMVAFCMPLVRIGQWQARRYRLGILALLLMGVVLFSTGTENSGYIIAVTGVAIWYFACSRRNRVDMSLLIFCICITGFGTSDLVPSVIRNGIIRPYSLKALPVMLVWGKLVYELVSRNYVAEAANFQEIQENRGKIG